MEVIEVNSIPVEMYEKIINGTGVGVTMHPKDKILKEMNLKTFEQDYYVIGFKDCNTILMRSQIDENLCCSIMIGYDKDFNIAKPNVDFEDYKKENNLPDFHCNMFNTIDENGNALCNVVCKGLVNKKYLVVQILVNDEVPNHLIN